MKYGQNIDRNSVIKGEILNFKFYLKNNDYILYPYIRVKFLNANRLFSKQFESRNLSLRPSSEKSYTYQLECRYRGRYSIGIERIEVEDFLGIFRFTRKMQDSFAVTVYPRILYLENFDIKTSFMSESHSFLSSKHEDASTISDIKKYVLGDSLRKIHWKLSAKMNELMVKNYQSTCETNTIMLFDLMDTGLDEEQSIIVEDKMVESAVAVLYYCLSNWIRVNFIYYNNEVINVEAKNMSDFPIIYEFLAETEFKSNMELADIMAMQINEGMSKTNIILFTSRIDYNLYNEIKRASLIGHIPYVVYISQDELTQQPNYVQQDLLSSLCNLGIKIYKININDDIKEVLEQGNYSGGVPFAERLYQ